MFVFHRGNRKRDIDQFAALGETHSFKVLDAASGTNAFNDGLLVGMEVLRNKLENRRANHLFCRIAEEARSSRIPAGDDAVQVFAQDYVVGGFDDRRQLAEVLRALSQSFLGLFDPRNIAYRAENLRA